MTTNVTCQKHFTACCRKTHTYF